MKQVTIINTDTLEEKVLPSEYMKSVSDITGETICIIRIVSPYLYNYIYTGMCSIGDCATSKLFDADEERTISATETEWNMAVVGVISEASKLLTY